VGRPLLPGEKCPSLGFLGFHALFNRVYNHITLALRDDLCFDVCEHNEVPEYLIFSVYSKDHLSPRYDRCVKIFTCEENQRVPWHECDYALTGDRLQDLRHLRLPVYAGYLRHLSDNAGTTLVKPVDYDARRSLAGKTRFCNFVYSNSRAEERILFFRILSKYKKVDSGGAVLNNLGTRVRDKLSFLANYKFTIAFENSRYPGYITEKLVEAMAAGSLPIYWGCRDVGSDFNPFSFVHANEPEGSDRNELVMYFEQVAQRVAWLDQHDDEYLEILSRPWFSGNLPNQYCQPSYATDFFRKIFATSRKDLPKRDPIPAPLLSIINHERTKNVDLDLERLVTSWNKAKNPPHSGHWSWADKITLLTPTMRQTTERPLVEIVKLEHLEAKLAAATKEANILTGYLRQIARAANANQSNISREESVAKILAKLAEKVEP
jgi:hypothetical protein